MYNITFVTCFIKIYDYEYDDKQTFEKRLELFNIILKSKINICIFISQEYKELFEMYSRENENLKIGGILNIDDLEFTKIGKSIGITNLPLNRHPLKDTVNYINLMNSKIEFLNNAINKNVFNNEIFCWLDFSIVKIFKDYKYCIEKLKYFSEKKFIDDFICMPGCWDFKTNDINYLSNNVNWRFCGGFFIGSSNKMQEFYNISINYYRDFLCQTNTYTWEVNYMAWLEANNLINPIWYYAVHDDSIINLPDCIFI